MKNSLLWTTKTNQLPHSIWRILCLTLVLALTLSACQPETLTPVMPGTGTLPLAQAPTGTPTSSPEAYPPPEATLAPTPTGDVQPYPPPEGTAAPPSPTGQTLQPTPTSVLPLTPSITPAPSPTVTQTPGPSPTPTPLFLVLPATPLPLPIAPINLGNAAQVSALAEWQDPSVTDLAWTPDGSILAVAHVGGISLYDIQTRTLLRSLYPRGEGVINLAFSPDGAWLATGNRYGSERESFAGNIQLWRGPYWEPLGILYGETRGITEVAFSPSEKLFTAGFVSLEIEQNHTVDFWNTTTWEITRTLQTGTVLNLAFSPDGRLLATVPDRYATRLWRVRDGDLLQTLHTSFTGAVNCLAFSPDSRALATGHYDGFIRIWDAATGSLVSEFATSGVVESLAFNPDGTLLASGNSYQNNWVQLWVVPTGELISTLKGHAHGVESLIFSPDGQILVSGSYQGTVRLWGVRP